MDDYNYHISKELNNLLIREGENLPIQKYDPDAKAWITDWDMLAIYTGSIIAIPISREDAMNIIRNGGKDGKNYKIKIICEYEKERQEWEALSAEEQHKW